VRVSLARFLGWSAVLLPISTVVTLQDGVDPVRRATAWSAWWVAELMGLRTTLVGSEIYTRTRVLDVATACMPLSVLAVAIALSLATKAPPRTAAAGVAVAVIGQWLANVARVCVGIVAAQQVPGVFDMLHRHVLSLVPVVTAFVVWAAWARWADATR
jgi:exosortase/archaeosortase family protein